MIKNIKTILIAIFILLFSSLNVNAYTVGAPPTMLPPAYSSYAPNSAAADQGVTSTAYVTLKNLVDAIGATDQATIIVSHSGATAQTTYTLTTNESVPANQMLYFENGAIIDGAGTLTLDSPEQIMASPNQQIFGSSITVTFTYGGIVYPEWWGQNTTPGTTDMSAAVQSAINSSADKIVYNSNYLCDSEITLASDQKHIGNGIGTLIQGSATRLLTGASISNFEIDGLVLEGNATSTGATADTDNGINLSGCNDFTISKCDISGFRHNGIRTVNTNNFSVLNNYLHGQLTVGDFADIYVNKYADAQEATTEDFVISGNRCFSTNRVGVEIHTATDFTITNNISSDHTKHGIIAYMPATDIQGTITGNVCKDNGWTGIYLNGLGASNKLSITVSGNTCIRNGGDGGANPQFNAGISLYDVTGASVTGNTIRDNTNAGDAANGISLFWTSTDCVITGNTINEVSGYGIWVNNTIHRCSVTNNTVKDATLDGIYAYHIFETLISNNAVHSCGNHGIWAESESGIESKRNVIAGNTVSENSKHGIYVNYFDDGVINHNMSTDNCQTDTAAGNYDGIYAVNSDSISLVGNLCRNATAAVGQRYGIITSSCTYEYLANNVLENNRTGTLSTGTRPIGQITAAKNTTANRPANPDQGTVYLDTTLDADGLPIIYNGAKWIKFDGTDG